ncbi:MAG: Crp/Fnr family transcriptional regulator [Candidatus Binataceae bacterium]
MSRRQQARAPYSGNDLLAALAPVAFNRLRPHLRSVKLSLRQIVSPAGDAIRHVYFPETGMISLVQRMADGGVTEVGMIGREGFFGIPLLLGARTGVSEANVQMKGTALRMSAKAFQAAVSRNGDLKARLLRFSHALHGQVTQTAACNARHSLRQKLARWLLTAHDRAAGDELVLSHEFLSMMLGTRRAGVTTALGKMRVAGLIASAAGRVAILDRAGLEAAACECYGVVRAEYRRLLD